MRNIALHILLLAAPICHAQTENGNTIGKDSATVIPARETAVPLSAYQQSSIAQPAAAEAPIDSLARLSTKWELEPQEIRLPLFTMWRPGYPFGGGVWNLHPGLNAEIGAGVMVGFGKNNPFRGASFFTDISLLYAQPLSDRWTLAIGGDLSRFRIWNEDVFTTRVQGLLNYKINEQLDATVYGFSNIPSLSSDRNAFAPFLERTSAIGAALTWKCSNSATFGISFEHNIVNDNMMPPPQMLPANPNSHNNNRR